MAKQMIFEVDRTSVVEGDVVAVTWDCSIADRAELTIDNGFRSTVIPLDKSGTKRFRLNRSKGATRLTVTAYFGDRPDSKTVKVRVRPMPTTRAEEVDSRGNPVGALGGWWHRTQPKLRDTLRRAEAEFRGWPRWARIAFWVVIAVLVLGMPVRWLLPVLALAVVAWILLRKQ